MRPPRWIRGIMFWVVFNVPLGRLAPHFLGWALGSKPQRLPHVPGCAYCEDLRGSRLIPRSRAEKEDALKCQLCGADYFPGVKNVGVLGRLEGPPEIRTIDKVRDISRTKSLGRIADALEGIQKDLNAIWAEHTAKGRGTPMDPEG